MFTKQKSSCTWRNFHAFYWICNKSLHCMKSFLSSWLFSLSENSQLLWNPNFVTCSQMPAIAVQFTPSHLFSPRLILRYAPIYVWVSQVVSCLFSDHIEKSSHTTVLVTRFWHFIYVVLDSLNLWKRELT